MKLSILGTGCKRSQRLTDNTRAALEALGLEAEIEQVRDLRQIGRYGILPRPVLVVDGHVRLSGRVASAAEIGRLLAG